MAAVSGSNIQTELLKAIDERDVYTVRSILSMDEITPSIVNRGFRHAVDDLNKKILDVFLESDKIAPITVYQLSLISAVLNGDTEEFHTLLADPDINPSEFDNISLQLAIAGGHVDMVRALLANPHVDPRVPNYIPFFTIVGASVNKVELLRIFLNDPRIDPTVQDNKMYNRIIEKLQDSNTTPQQKEEYEQMLDLLRTASRRFRVATAMRPPQKAGRPIKTRRLKKRRGTRNRRRANASIKA